ncbi:MULTISPECIES: PilW family protein [Metapseudomonas]|nr:PilW family protein [Pseudomonas furukawaii]ELS24612.1 Type IV fimbrial biogenesis protein PilW [Pseudomonas furukawaii]
MESRHHSSGFSLIELMVTILLSSLLLLGVLQLFNDASSSDRANSALSRLQESGRIALDVIKRDIRRTGYQGCASSSIASRTGSSLIFPRDAFGTRNETAVNGGVIEGVGTGSDTLTIRYASPTPITVSAIGGTSLTLASPMSFSTDQTFLLTDCLNVVIFKPNAAGENATTLTTANSNFSGVMLGARLYRVVQSTYAICASGRGLCRNNHDGAGAQELIADAENFQVLYGIRNGGQTRWITATDLSSTLREQVSQVKLSLVISSPDNASSGASSQQFAIANLGDNSTLAAVNDQRIRRAFTTAIELRNRQ